MAVVYPDHLSESRRAVWFSLNHAPRAITWSDIADAAGVSKGVVTRFAQNEHACLDETVAKIAAGLKSLGIQISRPKE